MKRTRIKERRRREALKSVIPSTDPIPHDRRASELPKGAQVAPIEVDDPFSAGEKVIAFRSIQTDPLAWLHTHSRINIAQFEGGRWWQHSYEILEGGIRSIDPSVEAVDGGKIFDPFTDAKVKAAKTLLRARKELGVEGEAITRDCLVERMLPRQIAEKRGKLTDRDITYYSRRLVECLELLAILGGFVMPKNRC